MKTLLSVLVSAAPKTQSPLTLSLCVLLVCAGCATLNQPPPTYPVDSRSTVELTAEFKWWPQMSGYYLPAGIYTGESEEPTGVFFRAPPGAKLLSLGGSTPVEARLFLAKPGPSKSRGYVSIKMPASGWQGYDLPAKFFSGYGTRWRILQQ